MVVTEGYEEREGHKEGEETSLLPGQSVKCTNVDALLLEIHLYLLSIPRFRM